MFDSIEGARATFQNDIQLIAFEESDPTKTPGLLLNLTIEQAGAPRMPYNAPLPDVDVALIEDWLRAGAPGVCNNLGGSACLGNYKLPCKHADVGKGEEGAYDLSKLTQANNCTATGKTCVAGECL